MVVKKAIAHQLGQGYRSVGRPLEQGIDQLDY